MCIYIYSIYRLTRYYIIANFAVQVFYTLSFLRTWVYKSIKKAYTAGMVAHTCNLRIWEAEAGRMPILGQPGLRKEMLS
jgi:hypothetical protein